jgi:hypothetical protein
VAWEKSNKRTDKSKKKEEGTPHSVYTPKISESKKRDVAYIAQISVAHAKVQTDATFYACFYIDSTTAS